MSQSVGRPKQQKRNAATSSNSRVPLFVQAKVVLRNPRPQSLRNEHAAQDRLAVRIAAHVAVRHVRVAALFVMPVERVEMMMLGATVLRARRRSGCLGGFGLFAHVRVLRKDACAAET